MKKILLLACLTLVISPQLLIAQEKHGIIRPELQKGKPSNLNLEAPQPPKITTVQPVPVNLGRKKIGLVLKGGGALGFAHVGVLKVLERNRIPVDLIAGTSMGSIVGAAYASGSSLENMERILTTTNWDVLFGEKIERQNVDFRLKAGRSREIYGDAKIGFGNGKIFTPMGAVEGQNIRPLFQNLFGNLQSPLDFNSLPVPFRAVTTDLETGAVYVPDSGDLATIVRASMSIPGAFSPVIVDGHVLVDGGLANNLPVDVALAMGSDTLIVVDLKSELAKASTLTSPLSISGQMVSMLLMQNSALSLNLIRDQDVVIAPNVAAYAVTDFALAAQIMAIGEKAAEEMVPALLPLALSEDEYKKYYEKRHYKDTTDKIDFIRIRNNSSVSAGRIDELMKVRVGDEFDAQRIEADIQNIYQTGYFKTVQYTRVQDGDKSGIEIDANAKDWLAQFVRLGFSLEDDLDGGDAFRLAGAFRTDSVASKDSYFESQIEIGKTPRFSLEIYQPIVEHSPYFFAPKLSIDRNNINVRRENEEIAEYLRTEETARISLGRRLSTLGEARIDYFRGIGDLGRRIGDPALPDKDYNIGDLTQVLELDNLDQPDFPTTGFRTQLKFNSAIPELGAPTEFQEIRGSVLLPYTFGRQTLLIKNEFASTFGERPIERYSSIGGFLNVSGTSSNSIPTSDYETASLLLLRRYSGLQNPFFNIDFFMGASYEITTINNGISALGDYGLINSGSLMAGIDTPLLPLYVGIGRADLGETSVYVTLGRLGQSGR